MDYQIVPGCKHVPGKTKKQRHYEEQNCKKCGKCEKVYQNDKDDDVFILQPMLKLPKSTREITNTGDDENSLIVNAVRASNNSKNSKGETYNHFTMSRKGLVKSMSPSLANMSRTEDPWLGKNSSPASPQPPVYKDINNNNNNKLYQQNGQGNDRRTSIAVPTNGEDFRAYHRRVSYFDGSARNTAMPNKERLRRRASAGDALIKSNRKSVLNGFPHNSPRILTLGPDEVLVIPQRKQHKSEDSDNDDKVKVIFLYPIMCNCLNRFQNIHNIFVFSC